MEKLENLELVEVERNEKDTNLTLLLLDNEAGFIYPVKFNKQKWNNEVKKFEDNPEQLKWVNEKLNEYLGFDWDNAEKAIGKEFDVYVYEKFNSLWKSEQLAKPDEELEKKIRSGYKTKILDVKETNKAFEIIVEIEGNKYSVSNTCDNKGLKISDWINSRNAYFKNPSKYAEAKNNFEKEFGVPVEEKEKIIGREVTIFPARAGKTVYLKLVSE